MLRTKEQWENEFEKKVNPIKGDYIFCYLLGRNKETRYEIKRLSEETNLPIWAILHTDEYIEFDDGENLPYIDEETIKNWVLGNSKVPDWVTYHFTNILNCRIDDIFIETNEE